MLESKITARKEALSLRDQVNYRSFGFTEDNRTHIQRILWLGSVIQGLEDKLERLKIADTEPVGSLTAPSQKEQELEVAASEEISQPEVPQTTPQSHHELEGPISTPAPIPLHKSITRTRKPTKAVAARARKLYRVAPYLNDSLPMKPRVEISTEDAHTTPNIIFRFVFREFLISTADSGTLARANQIDSINAFLLGSSKNKLDTYIKFFSDFHDGIETALCYLRSGVCDFLIDRQNAPKPSDTIRILGAEIVTEPAARKIGPEGWDILWDYFHDVVSWWNIEFFAIHYEDLLSVKILMAGGRYGINTEFPISIRPEAYIPLNVLQPGHTTKSLLTNKLEYRRYLGGRMSRNDPFALALAKELGEQVAKYYVFVYDRTLPQGNQRLDLLSNPDESLWIVQTRSELNFSWKTYYSVKETRSRGPAPRKCRRTVVFDHILMDSHIHKDYDEFIIVERESRLDIDTDIDILDGVTDALYKLHGKIGLSRVLNEPSKYLVEPEDLDQCALGPDISIALDEYVDSRVGCWDISIPPVDTLLTSDLLPGEFRFVSKVATDLESYGVLTKVLVYKPQTALPVVLNRADGLQDLYFRIDPDPRMKLVLR
ncbi:hypothetical protein TWF730_004332 [Orbilia blumenaviensis]|uniref:Uncharacterized protein n=1 Tax=Orbilia blumenaviensis TaxID=1796055 RepID=A0AAV9U401_9PEZI